MGYKKRIRLKGFDYKGCYRYSLTFCTREKAAYFTDADVVSNAMQAIQDAAEKNGFKIWTICFMPDHLHVLAEGESPAADLKKFVSGFKQRSGYWFRQSRGKDLWQINYYEHVLRSDEATEKVARYILENPTRKGLAEDFRTYPFSMCEVFGFVGQGFSLANQANLKVCPTEDKSRARLQPCKSSNPEGLPYKGRDGRSNAGFTLIEMVMTIVLVGILAGVAAMIIMQGARSYSAGQSRGEAHQQARFAMDRMAREIRLIRSRATAPVDDIISMTGSVLDYIDVNGTQVGFQLIGTNLQRRENAGAWQTLATGITAPGNNPFTYLDVNGIVTGNQAALWAIQIDLTATQGSESLTLRTRVHPRNF